MLLCLIGKGLGGSFGDVFGSVTFQVLAKKTTRDGRPFGRPFLCQDVKRVTSLTRCLYGVEGCIAFTQKDKIGLI